MNKIEVGDKVRLVIGGVRGLAIWKVVVVDGDMVVLVDTTKESILGSPKRIKARYVEKVESIDEV